MADTFWGASTPPVSPSAYPAAYLATRIAGVGGAPDSFAQIAIADLLSAILSGLSNLPDEAKGDAIPSPGSKLPYLSGGVLKFA